jgi:hypothetical protein
MKTKSIFSYLWKTPLCGIAYFIGMAIGGGLLPAFGLQAPDIPAGTDANTIALWFFLGSIFLALPLSILSRNLQVKSVSRWLILFALTWGVGGIGMVLESYFFMETGSVSSIESTIFTLLNFMFPSLTITGMVIWLFPPKVGSRRTRIQMPVYEWAWKIAVALVSYPLVYFVFGLLVEPFVMEYYTAGTYELVLPTWGQMIPLQLTRSLLFLLVCLPVIQRWNGTSKGLWVNLSTAFFLLTAFMAVITSYWFPWNLRFFHGLELMVDAATYIGILVLLFSRKLTIIKEIS